MNNSIKETNENDVLCGRGGSTNSHSGNVQFRSLVLQHQDAYKQATSRFAKVTISEAIIKLIRNMNPPGRFVTEVDGSWFDIGDAKAKVKVSQALREKRAYTQVLCTTKEDSQSVHECSLAIPLQDDQTLLTQNSSDREDLDPVSGICSRDQGIPLNVTCIENSPDLKKFNCPKRLLFRELKEEQTCLPWVLPESTNLRHENNLILMRERLESADSKSALMRERLESIDSKSTFMSERLESTDSKSAFMKERLESTDSKSTFMRERLESTDSKSTFMRERLESTDSKSMSSIEKPWLKMSKQLGKLTAVDNIAEETDLTHEFDNSFEFSNSFEFHNDSKMDSTDKFLNESFMSSVKSFDFQYDLNILD